MMKIRCLSILLIISTMAYSQETIEGVWEAIDDRDHEPSSHIRIKVVNGELTGTIIKLFDVDEDILCEFCQGDKKNQAIKGMSIIYNMKKAGANWSGGHILDPKNGKQYKCNIELKGDDILKLRAYIGVPVLGRTQTWYRVE